MPMNLEQPMQAWPQSWPGKRKNAATQWYSQGRRDIGLNRPVRRDDLPF